MKWDIYKHYKVFFKALQKKTRQQNHVTARDENAKKLNLDWVKEPRKYGSVVVEWVSEFNK